MAAWLAVLQSSASAMADEVTVRRGDVEATLSYQPRQDFGYRSHLTIVRAGTTAYDRDVRGRGCGDRCSPVDFGTLRPLRVADLSGDDDPEVVLQLHTGGAHCCFLGEVFQRRGDTYDVAQRNFGDGAVDVKDVDGDGTSEIRTGDTRFSYAFTAHAFARLPLQVWEFRHRRFADRTRSYPGALRADASRWWREYVRRRGGSNDVRGIFAAWAADTTRLHHSRKAKRELARGVSNGWFPSVFGDPGGRDYAARLWRFLKRIGYR
jgi:hypothetical protein